MTGPLAALFGQLMAKRRAEETEALRARLGAGDPGGTIYLDSKPSPLPVVSGWDWQTGQNQTPLFRGPEMDAGPAPPTGRGPLAAMFGKDKKKHE